MLTEKLFHIRKLIASAIACLGALSLVADTETVDGITWTYSVDAARNWGINDDTRVASLVSVPSSTSGAITIPSTLGGYPVVGICDEAFIDCSGLTSVTIPDGVVDIGPSAFSGCSGLTSVTIPNSVMYIGVRAFYGCSGLTNVTIPNSVTYIGDRAFYGCSGLTSVTMPDNVTEFSMTTFDGCGKLWCRILSNASASGGGSSSVSTTIVQQVESPYVLTDHVADRAIASVTVNSDCAIDSFVLRDGKVYDSMLRIVNTADHEVRLKLPSGYVYETFEGVDPLTIPANSRNMLSITRTADKTFLVSREKLKTIQ